MLPSSLDAGRRRLRLLVIQHRTRLLLFAKPFAIDRAAPERTTTCNSQGEARVRWFQCLLGTKIPRLAVFRLPATRLSGGSRTRMETLLLPGCVSAPSCHPPLPAGSDLTTTLDAPLGCLGWEAHQPPCWCVRLTWFRSPPPCGLWITCHVQRFCLPDTFCFEPASPMDRWGLLDSFP